MERNPAKPVVVGVRHHSPACARLVRNLIRQLRPAHILIEGPVDMNERMGELHLSHQLPVAIFSFLQMGSTHHASWSPFCEYSPEWVALNEGAATNCSVRFIDLPAWAHSSQDSEVNRYSDEGAHNNTYVESLCMEFGMEGGDSLWDHLFEQPMAEAALETRLSMYFEHLRDGRGAESEGGREQYMARHVAQAMHTKQPDEFVLVVCGGWHKPALEAMWSSMEVEGWPMVPEVLPGARYGTYLVPYSFERLDSFTGYQAGMPSPQWYQQIWEQGTESVMEHVLGMIASQLRSKDVPMSSADLVGVVSMVRGLMSLRSHAHPTRVDLLDSLASTLLKDPQDGPLPWNQRAVLSANIDPILGQVLSVLRGERYGKLADTTPTPALVDDVEEALTHFALSKTPRRIELDLLNENDRENSVLLHRLRLLCVPGFIRHHGPSWATDGELSESWEAFEHLDQRSSLIEASIHGGTLELASSGKLLRTLQRRDGASPSVDELVDALADALFCDLASSIHTLLGRIDQIVEQESSLGSLGEALSKLLALYRHDSRFGAHQDRDVGVIMGKVVGRILWLVEGLQGCNAPADPAHIQALIALRDTHRYTSLSDVVRTHAVLCRCLSDCAAPPAVKGGALGFLWSEQALVEDVLEVIRGVSLPDTIGAFLQGLFSLARSEVCRDPSVIATLDDLLLAMSEEEFLLALPSMRLAYAVFPARERAKVAEQVVRLGDGLGHSSDLTRKLPVCIDAIRRAAELEASVDRIERDYGLVP